MRSKASNIINLNWNTPLELLSRSKKPSPTFQKLSEAGLTTIKDLLWVLPLRINKTPSLQTFRDAELNQFFRGAGQVIHIELKPAFGRRGKGNVLLYNGYAVLKDDLSHETMGLRWFNLYPNHKKHIESFDHISFLGQVQDFKAQKQIINPQIIDSNISISPYIIEYPSLNKISGANVKKIIELIPKNLWDIIPETIPELSYNKKLTISDAFKIIHGKIDTNAFNNKLKEMAEERLIYEEFLIDQLKIQTRRKFIKKKNAPVIFIEESKVNDLVKNLPFVLTDDQLKVFGEIVNDLKSGHPMMRMVQGDVGCGKTIIAFLSARITNKCGFQVALMCPTEALAIQHFESFKQLNPALNMDLLLGSTKTKEKKDILKKLTDGETEIVIGTHSLFQTTVNFKKLGLAIIDEQHKFGVDQRLRLIAKGEGVHSLIMSATPIPRTLCLAQYGDLDISLIRMMPAGRMVTKTRITEKVNYEKYIDFIKGRLALGEQAYLVFPAIEESETEDIQNVKDSLKKYQTIFKNFVVGILHGQMKSDEKEKIIMDFRNNNINILIATSVIEVGINIPNATIMSIYNPERFGLSSLHQLRGRVGRGNKAGFCFLVLNKEISLEARERLQVIEKNIDGFIIAEEDLKFRGEGDLFGVDQSGNQSSKKLANYARHSKMLEEVVKDLATIQTKYPDILQPHFERLAKDQKILDTI
jgi:ATP-dependent DNA helicase RecG